MRLSRYAASQIQNLFRRVEALEAELSSKAIYSTYGREAVIVEAEDGGIPAIDGDVPGTAIALIVRRYSDDPEATKELRTTSTVERVYNASSRAVEAGERVMCVRDFFGDLFVVFSGGADFDECSGGGLTIPGLADSPIVDATEADYIVGIRDGCTVLVEVEQCEEESGGGSGSVSISESAPISGPPEESVIGD